MRIMKNGYLGNCILLILGMFGAFSHLYGQHGILDIDQQSHWVEVYQMNISSAEYFPELKEDLELHRTDFALLENSFSEKKQHIKYQQIIDGIRVLGGIHILHQNDGFVDHANGFVWPEPVRQQEMMVNQGEALKLAQEAHVNEVWDRGRLKQELVWADEIYPRKSGRLKLAWLIDVHSIQPIKRRRMLIDATDGHFIMDINRLCGCHSAQCYECGVETMGAEGPTLYHGQRDIAVKFESKDTQYVLKTDDGFPEVTTWKIDTTHFFDEDGIFETGDEAYRNGALDAHWSVVQTRNYFREKFNRDGIEGKGEPIFSYIFPVERSYNNAFWNGSAMFYGPGDSSRYGPFTSIDICAHEFTHGVTEFTAGLEYTYESGAMNEAISDIFGKVIEREYESNDFSWELGHRIDFRVQGVGVGFRHMADPHIHGDPKYYKGINWWESQFDNGGVHVNSGVLNYWFYLLSEGGQGITENDENYDVTGIGAAVAIELVYEMLVNYLTPTSQFIDARDASMKIARDRFKDEPDRIRSVAQAWYAVGLGYPLVEMDLGVKAGSFNTVFCGDILLTPRVDIFNLSLDSILPQGTAIEVSYQYRDEPLVTEVLVLPETLLPGEKYEYTFSNMIEEDVEGRYDLRFAIRSDWDITSVNNEDVVEVRWLDNLDFDVEVFPSNDARSACNRRDSTSIFFAGQYHGCSIISSKDSFLMTVIMHGDTMRRYINPLRTVYPGAFVFFGEFDFVDLPFGQNRAYISFDHAMDPTKGDNGMQIDFYRIKSIDSYYEEDFESEKLIDSSRISLGAGIHHSHRVEEVDGRPGLVIRGQGVLDSEGQLLIDTNSKRLRTFFRVNPNFVSNFRWCVDLEKMIRPTLEFEVMREVGDIRYENFGTTSDLACAIGVEFGGFTEYLDTMPYGEFVVRTYDLPVDEDEIVVELQNLILTTELDSITGKSLSGDRIVYRNIKIYDKSLNVDDDGFGSIEIHPNPSSEEVFLSATSGYLPAGRYRVMNVLGEVMSHFEIEKEVGQRRIQLMGPSGTYFIFYKNKGGGSSFWRIVKK